MLMSMIQIGESNSSSSFFTRLTVEIHWTKNKYVLTYVGKALESVMCEVIKICIKRRIAARSSKGNQPLNIKTDVERPILKLGLSNSRWSFYFILFLVATLLFRRIFMTSHTTFSSASTLAYGWMQKCIDLMSIIPHYVFFFM